METISQLRQIIINSSTCGSTAGSKKLEMSILSAIKYKKLSDEKIQKCIDNEIKKNKISIESLFEVAKNIEKKANRTKHSFSSIDELNAFMKSNQCGDAWLEIIDGKTVSSVYCYG